METEHSNLIENNTEDEYDEELTNDMDDFYKFSVMLTNLIHLTLNKGSVVVDRIYDIIDKKKETMKKKI